MSLLSYLLKRNSISIRNKPLFTDGIRILIKLQVIIEDGTQISVTLYNLHHLAMDNGCLKNTCSSLSQRLVLFVSQNM